MVIDTLITFPPIGAQFFLINILADETIKIN